MLKRKSVIEFQGSSLAQQKSLFHFVAFYFFSTLFSIFFLRAKKSSVPLKTAKESG